MHTNAIIIFKLVTMLIENLSIPDLQYWQYFIQLDIYYCPLTLFIVFTN